MSWPFMVCRDRGQGESAGARDSSERGDGHRQLIPSAQAGGPPPPPAQQPMRVARLGLTSNRRVRRLRLKSSATCVR